MMNHGLSNVRSVSIVICSKNRHDSLLKTLSVLERYACHEKLLEVIIIEETDHPEPPRGEYFRYFSIPERNLGLAYARNLGLQKASGSIVVYIDDDIVPAPYWLDALIEPFDDPQVSATGGAVLPDISDINAVGRCISFLGFPAGGIRRYLESRGEALETKHISGGNCAIRKSAALQIGGFDEFMRCVEDTDFFHRMIQHKKKLLFIPRAVVFHKQRDSLEAVFKWFIRRGIGDFSLKCKHQGLIYALLMPVRMNFTLKLLVFLMLLWVLHFLYPPSVFIALIAVPVMWNQLLWQRIHRTLGNRAVINQADGSLRQIRDEICTKGVRRILFLVKFMMDLGNEAGTFLAFFRYLNNRFISKPFVLTFHYLYDQVRLPAPSSRRYHYPAAGLEELLRLLEIKGYFVVALSAMLKRLRENPRSLFIDKIVAVTFDDADENTFAPLCKLAGDKCYPITIFVPTNRTGQITYLDSATDAPPVKVMDWTQIRRLKDIGIEIGAHTRSHCHLTAIPRSLLDEEIGGSLADLRSQFPDYASDEIVFSYPYGEYNQEVVATVKKSGYLGAVANFPRNIRPATDPFQIPRFSVQPGMAASDILNRSRSLWFRELIKDIRDLVNTRFLNGPQVE